ncbi:MAG TPA: ATP-binding cassette domain-containing protein, partial [Anaerolineae bacterium]|nr:ATP-binding cassette domain-containing protein [Anaerolineae bacterium]
MIKMRNVVMSYKGAHRPALKDISVDIDRGEFVFLVGPSGCGKSTFIRLLLRELVPVKGNIAVAGHDLVNMRRRRVPQLRRNIGCVFQDFKLLPNKTVYENVAFALEVIGRPTKAIRAQV